MEKTKRIFNALLQECKVKDIGSLVEIVVDQEPNRKAACEIMDIPYDPDMKSLCRSDFLRRSARLIKNRVLAPVVGFLNYKETK